MLRVKKLPIYANANIVVLNTEDLNRYGLKVSDRILLKKDGIERVSIVDIDNTGSLVKEGEIGIFTDIKEFKDGDLIDIEPLSPPRSVEILKKKSKGHELSYSEIYEIIQDVKNDKLLPIEIAHYLATVSVVGMSLEETTNLTKAMVEVGEKIYWPEDWIVVDKHSIGGIPNNRVTPIIVPIIASTGLKIPKTSSRAITSPAGTADVIEVLSPVDLNIEEIMEIVRKTNGCMVWGGALDISPVDDKLIRIEKALMLDPVPQLIASVLSKKLAIGSKYVVIDIPYGETAKVKTVSEGVELARKFVEIGKRLGINVRAAITKGFQPIGNGIGPVLEIIDVIKVLKNDGPEDLKEKALELSGQLLNLVNMGDYNTAKQILESGKAFDKFVEIIEAQGGSVDKDLESMLEKYTFDVVAKQDGRIISINNILISKLARLLGSPKYKGAGLYLYKKVGDYVKKGDILFRMYAPSENKIDIALKFLENNPDIYIIEDKYRVINKVI